MEAPQQNLISNASKAARVVLGQLEAINELDVLYNGSPQWVNLITQDQINSVPSFLAAGLTVQNIADVIYNLKLIKVQAESNLPALIMLANLP